MKGDFYYFAEDGNFGDANSNFLLTDTSKWNEHDWQSVEEAPDSLRVIIARSIAERYFYNEQPEGE